MAWTRSMKKPWNLFPSNETYEKAVKIIAVQPALLKSHENCYPPTTYEKAMKMFTLERAMKILWNSKDHSQRDFIIDNKTVGSTDKSSQLISFIPWGYFLSTIVTCSPNLFRPSSLLLGACHWYDVLVSHCMWFIACDRETKSISFCLHKLNLNGLFAAFKDVASSLVSQAYPGFRTCLVALGLLGYW